eukprot:1954891-Alexandrium_andersonii.AAC.1
MRAGPCQRGSPRFARVSGRCVRVRAGSCQQGSGAARVAARVLVRARASLSASLRPCGCRCCGGRLRSEVLAP